MLQEFVIRNWRIRNEAGREILFKSASGIFDFEDYVFKNYTKVVQKQYYKRQLELDDFLTI